MPATKYNTAPQTQRLGLTQRNKYASLHGQAHDKHSGSYTPPKCYNSELENADVNRPPQDSDQESDNASHSDISAPDNEKLKADTMSTAPLDEASAKFFIQKKKPNVKTYGKSKQIGNSKPVQKAKPPRHKGTLPLGFNRPAAAKANEDLLRKLDSEQEFNHAIVPSKAYGGADADFEPFQHPPKKDSGIRSGTKGSVAFPSPKTEAFVAPLLEPPLGLQTIASSQVSDTVNDIDEFIKRRAVKTGSQNDSGNDADNARPTKKRRITPEPEFVAPPPPLSSSNADGLSLGVSLDLALPEGNCLPYIDAPARVSSPILISSVSTSQQTVCPMCTTPVEQATLDSFKKQNKLSNTSYLSTRQQELFHKFHSKIEAKQSWQERKYPNITWSKLGQRLTQHKSHLLSIINGTNTSDFATRLQQTLSRRGRRSAVLADEKRAGETNAQDLGYYGTRGQRIVGDWLVREFSTQLRQQAPDHALIKLAGGVGGYVAKVLVPETIYQLIKQDLWNTKGMLSAAQARLREVISAEPGIDGTRSADRELRTLFHIMVQGADALPSDEFHFDEDSDTHWLVRFVAADSAQCGLLLSEEMEDVVRVREDKQDVT